MSWNTRGEPGAAGVRKPRLGRFFALGALVALDLWSKAAVFGWLQAHPERLVADCHPELSHERFLLLGSWLSLMESENPGAAFGKLVDFPYLLVGGRVVAVLILLVALWRTRREHTLVLFGVVLVLAGAAGNLYDNLLLDDPGDGHPFGLVRDFLDVYFPARRWHFPTFNVADSCITVGAVCFLLHGLFHREDAPGADAEGNPG